MKYAFVLVHILLVVAMARMGMAVYPRLTDPRAFERPVTRTETAPETVFDRTEQAQADPGQTDIIIGRNLFKVRARSDQPPDEPSENPAETENLEPTSLSLTLWGTVTGTSDPWAVIEDRAKREQALYREGDAVKEARLKKILKHKIILTHNGKDEVLEMETDSRNAGTSSSSLPQAPPPVPETGVVNPFTQMPMGGPSGQIMNQIRIRPYFSKGSPDGVMVYGIRPDSVFSRAGLRNGDIVREINGTPVASVEEASALLADLEQIGSIQATLLRSGQVRQITYPGEPGDESQQEPLEKEALTPVDQPPEKAAPPEDHDNNKGDEG